MEELFRWRLATDTQDYTFIPSVEARVIGNKFIVLNSDLLHVNVHDTVMLNYDDDSTNPYFIKENFGNEVAISWWRLRPYDERII